MTTVSNLDPPQPHLFTCYMIPALTRSSLCACSCIGFLQSLWYCQALQPHVQARQLSYTWLFSQLSNRLLQFPSAPDNCWDQTSTFLAINASIIQGSGLGPVSYILNASDLHPMHPSNILFKYADDTCLLVPATNSSLISHELKKHIRLGNW